MPVGDGAHPLGIERAGIAIRQVFGQFAFASDPDEIILCRPGDGLKMLLQRRRVMAGHPVDIRLGQMSQIAFAGLITNTDNGPARRCNTRIPQGFKTTTQRR